MNIAEQIQSILHLKEGCEVEYKSAKGGMPQSFWETFSAFANTNGGVIILGVKEKDNGFVPDGLTDEQIEKYKKEFWSNAHNKSCVNLPLLVESDVSVFVTEGGQRLLSFRIPRADYSLRPVHLSLTPFGHTYKRRHEGDYVCSDDEVRQMYSDANNIRSSADSRILNGFSINDIDMPTLQQYRREYNIKHENHPWRDIDDMKFLENIGAYRKDRVSSLEGFTVAGILMFGKSNSIASPECVQDFFPDYRERMSDDSKVRWTNRVYPDGTWESNLYQFYTRVLPMLQHALPVPFSLDGQQRRNDTTLAHVALREALANTLIHCAYTVKGNITIDRFPDRIVMSNPGTMLVSLDEYHEGGHSVCRNPVLQKMFVFLGVGEKSGSGADIISKGWIENGWIMPSIEEKMNPERVETILRMLSKGNIDAENHIVDKLSTKGKIVDKLSTKSEIVDKLSIKGRIVDKLSINQQIVDKYKVNDAFIDKIVDIMEFLFVNPHSSAERLSLVVNKSVSRTKNYLQAMVELECITPEGGNRNRTYSISRE